MKIDVKPGRYVVAVSGGVDSMTLLDLLAKQANGPTSSLELIVAHFNHGIRPDSGKDEKLVAAAANKYGLTREIGHGRLGSKASEEEARKARYSFLERIKKKYDSDAIITAHHQDDLIETAFINLLRGTGRRGLSSIHSKSIQRPLLNVSKQEVLKYARTNGIKWHEDETNSDTVYLRNYIRQKIMPALTDKKRQEIISNLDKVAKINEIINRQIANYSHIFRQNQLDRMKYTMLPTEVGEELIMHWLRESGLRDFDRKTIKRLSASIKTGMPGTKQPVYKGWQMDIGRQTASLTHP